MFLHLTVKGDKGLKNNKTFPLREVKTSKELRDSWLAKSTAHVNGLELVVNHSSATKYFQSLVKVMQLIHFRSKIYSYSDHLNLVRRKTVKYTSPTCT